MIYLFLAWPITMVKLIIWKKLKLHRLFGEMKEGLDYSILDLPQ